MLNKPESISAFRCRVANRPENDFTALALSKSDLKIVLHQFVIQFSGSKQALPQI
jgi:hypothetical protein